MRYFTPNENLDAVVRNTFTGENLEEIQTITTGWTNIVLDVKTDQGRYIFRLPRDEFWVKAIEKEAELVQFIQNKTDFTTVQLELIHDRHGRPFTKHRRIDGVPLAEEINNLSPSSTKTIAQELAMFLYQLHHIKFNLDEVFPVTNSGHNLTDFLNELLEVHIPKDDFKFWDYEKQKANEANCLVHGDFNTSNILLTTDHHVAAILDFGFGGLGNKYDDLSRIISRQYPDAFKALFLQAYEALSGEKLSTQQVNKSVTLWRDIDQAYIKYMTKIGIYHPE